MKGGINFEEWKEIVKKNRRSLRSKSNIFRFEPESLTYGAEKAVKSPEYGQIHTITYNVTGMEIPSSWPTEIKSGKTLTLNNIPEIPYGAIGTITASAQYTLDDNVMVINNVQSDLTITISIGDVLYENAKVGDYLYDDWTFSPTFPSPNGNRNFLGRCIGFENDGKSVWAHRYSNEHYWLTKGAAETTGLTYYDTVDDAKLSYSGIADTETLKSLGIEYYPAALLASEAFGGHGYLPAFGELYKYSGEDSILNKMYYLKYIWSSTEANSNYIYAINVSTKEAILRKRNTVGYSASVASFILLSGKIGEPINNNGHEYVDLGLPSGTLWATMNVGATSPTDYGNYYMYGMGSKTYESTDTPYDGTEDPLDLTKDTARQTWGGDWHMPTKTQMEELVANTTYQWVTNYKGSGINGGTYTATNGAVLFFPAVGYWYNGSQVNVGYFGSCRGSSPNGSNSAYILVFSSGSKDVGYGGRGYGYSVRPVIG